MNVKKDGNFLYNFEHSINQFVCMSVKRLKFERCQILCKFYQILHCHGWMGQFIFVHCFCEYFYECKSWKFWCSLVVVFIKLFGWMGQKYGKFGYNPAHSMYQVVHLSVVREKFCLLLSVVLI